MAVVFLVINDRHTELRLNSLQGRKSRSEKLMKRLVKKTRPQKKEKQSPFELRHAFAVIFGVFYIVFSFFLLWFAIDCFQKQEPVGTILWAIFFGIASLPLGGYQIYASFYERTPSDPRDTWSSTD